MQNCLKLKGINFVSDFVKLGNIRKINCRHSAQNGGAMEWLIRKIIMFICLECQAQFTQEFTI